MTRRLYFHSISSHPWHAKQTKVFSQRISRICLQAEDFRKNPLEMRPWFYKRGCPYFLVEKGMAKVKFSSCT